MVTLILFKAIVVKYNFNGGEHPVGVGDMSEVLNVSVPTVYRHLKKLLDADYIVKVANGAYMPKDIFQWNFDDLIGDDNG